MNKVNPFPALFTPHPLIFLPNLSITNESALVTNLGKTSLAKRTASTFSAFLPKLLIILPRSLPD